MYYGIIKYPRTPHLEGSRLQAGDEDLSQIPFREILGRNIVVEEKVDGANSAVSFDADGGLLIQSRGHYLQGGYRERHYNFLKKWANTNRELLFGVLGSRYVMYGEWMYAKHKIFYDALPDYFLEFDIYDRESRVFLDTDRRKEMTDKIGIISSVPVLARGVFNSRGDILGLIGNSRYITSNHMELLRRVAEAQGLDAMSLIRETDPATTMEGIYIKQENAGIVERRVKFVRASFLQSAKESESNWHRRPIIPNQLADNGIRL